MQCPKSVTCLRTIIFKSFITSYFYYSWVQNNSLYSAITTGCFCQYFLISVTEGQKQNSLKKA